MSFREGVRTSRRFHLLLPAELDASLRALARERGLSLAETIRSLSALGLEEGRVTRGIGHPESAVALATLTAAEHAVLMVASVLPEGESRMLSLANRAAEAAEERLALFRESAQ